MLVQTVQPIRVGFLIDRIYSGRGGTERQLLETIDRLDRAAFDPVLICLRSTPWLEQHRPTLRCRLYVVGFKGFLKIGALPAIGRLARIVNDEELHIVQTFFQDSIFVCAAASVLFRNRPRLLAWRRDIGLRDEPWYHTVFNFLMAIVHRRFRYILTNSDHVREFVVETWKVPASKVRTIYNGIALPAARSGIPAIMRRWPDDVWIVLVGNLRPVKRIDTLVRALARVRSDHGLHNVRAVVLGEGPREPSLRSLAGELGLTDRVFLEGSVGDVMEYLLNADIGVLCSEREGLSNSIMEYMACSLPVVATPVGGNRELVDGSNGFLVSPGDDVGLAAAIAALVRDPERRRTMGRRSREKLARYSWEATIRALEDQMKELA